MNINKKNNKRKGSKRKGSKRRKLNKSKERTLYPISQVHQIVKGGKSRRKSNYGYSNAQKAFNTIKYLKNKSQKIKMAIANTLLQRATYHPNQTKGMRDAIKIFKRYIDINKNKTKLKSKK